MGPNLINMWTSATNPRIIIRSAFQSYQFEMPDTAILFILVQYVDINPRNQPVLGGVINVQIKICRFTWSFICKDT